MSRLKVLEGQGNKGEVCHHALSELYCEDVRDCPDCIFRARIHETGANRSWQKPFAELYEAIDVTIEDSNS